MHVLMLCYRVLDRGQKAKSKKGHDSEKNKMALYRSPDFLRLL